MTWVTITLDDTKAQELFDLGYLLVMEAGEFNTETQTHEVRFRPATYKDI